MTPRVMVEWRDRTGQVVARVLQGVKPVGQRMVSVYYADVAGDRVERPRFQCAVRAVNEWAARTGVGVTTSSMR